MKLGYASVALVGSSQAVQISSRMMLETSLVGLEAPNPVPSHNLVDTTVDGQKFKKSDKKTTLTIVQDFRKLQAEQAAAAESTQLVQGRSSDVHVNGKQTTLTIVQDFPKKLAENNNNEELVMGAKTKLNMQVPENRT